MFIIHCLIAAVSLVPAGIDVRLVLGAPSMIYCHERGRKGLSTLASYCLLSRQPRLLPAPFNIPLAMSTLAAIRSAPRQVSGSAQVAALSKGSYSMWRLRIDNLSQQSVQVTKLIRQ